MTRLTSPQRDSRKKYAILLTIAASIFLGGIVWGNSAMASTLSGSFGSDGTYTCNRDFPEQIVCNGVVPSDAGGYDFVAYWANVCDPTCGAPTFPNDDAGCDADWVWWWGTGQSGCTTVNLDGTFTYSIVGDASWIGNSVNVEWRALGVKTGSATTSDVSYGNQANAPPGGIELIDDYVAPSEAVEIANNSQRQMSWLIGILTFGITLPIWRSIFRG